jgi:methanogenic corrinoid protein MtbC1
VEELRASNPSQTLFGRTGPRGPRSRDAIEAVLAANLIAPRRAAALPTAGTHATPVDERQIREFVRVTLDEDDAGVLRYVAELQSAGVAVESIYLDLLAPAARALGTMWVDDECSFVDVTVGVGRLQLVLRDLSQMFVRDRADAALAGSVLLACIPGEQHSLGLFMVAEFFIRDGWGVRVGPPLSERDLLADVRSSWYDVIGFSVSCDSRIDQLKREIARVRKASRNPRVLVMAGGRAFNDQPDLLARVGADASAFNAELAPERARQLMALA